MSFQLKGKNLSFNVQHITHEQLKNRKLLEKFNEMFKKFTKKRSDVIEMALFIENMLKVVILHFLVGTDYSRHQLLRALVFDAEFCSFMQKRKMLSTIFDMFAGSFNFLTDSEAKKIKRELNDFILQRDIFAHGVIFVDAQIKKVIIEYYRGKKTQTIIDNKMISAIRKRCSYLERQLSKINEFLRENRLDKEIVHSCSIKPIK